MKANMLKDKNTMRFEEFAGKYIGEKDCLKLSVTQRDDCIDSNEYEVNMCEPCKLYAKLLSVYYA